ADALNCLEQFSQASNNKHPNRVSGWGVFFSGHVGMTYSLRAAERRPGHGDARHLWRAGLRPVGKADALTGAPARLSGQFSQASNTKAPISNGWGFLRCASEKCIPAYSDGKRPANPSSQPD
ncbi:hypothetical protein, partial [Teredinibacter turnerae]